MTPTEHDKELREKLLREVIIMNSRAKVETNNYYSYEIKLADNSLDGLLALIAADRKRVALEARLNEVQNAYEYWINGRKFISSYFRDRIAQLSNTKESK